mmetsp:Transcript_19092/g.25863  ORF Transcript_19092/g.25863 Transcript_19092/m.25863 type:complete len:138 (+) Transcript_19092:530-943(+)
MRLSSVSPMDSKAQGMFATTTGSFKNASKHDRSSRSFDPAKNQPAQPDVAPGNDVTEPAAAEPTPKPAESAQPASSEPVWFEEFTLGKLVAKDGQWAIEDKHASYTNPFLSTPSEKENQTWEEGKFKICARGSSVEF